MNKSITINFTASIYDFADIKKAISDYHKICKIKTVESKRSICCTFYDSVADIEITAHEFSNYLIELSNTRSKL